MKPYPVWDDKMNMLGNAHQLGFRHYLSNKIIVLTYLLN
jgi:hypothetical protein